MQGVVKEKISAPFVCYHVPEMHGQISRRSVGRLHVALVDVFQTVPARGGVVAPERFCATSPRRRSGGKRQEGERGARIYERKKSVVCRRDACGGGGAADIDDPCSSADGWSEGAME